jgi:hypothetical protein
LRTFIAILMLFCTACSQESEQPTSEGLAEIESSEEENLVTLDDSLPELIGDAGRAGAVNVEVDEALLRALGYLASEAAHEETGVVRHDREVVQPGWNLYVSQHNQEAWLLDMEGETLHIWRGNPRETESAKRMERAEFDPWWRTVHLCQNGDLLAQTDYGSLARLDWNSNLLWVFRGHTHHDFDVRDDGHIFVITSSLANIPEFAKPVAEDFIVELDSEGNELRKVSIMSALIDGEQDEVLRELKKFHREANGVAGVDPLHTNSVELLDGSVASRIPAFARGNLLISLPMIGRAVVVDFEAGRVIWSMKGSFYYQHHTTMLANGNMMLFDNKGLGDARSRILEIDPISGKEIWSYGARESETFYSECCGRVYRLKNGNTLVVDSKIGRAFEIDSNHEIVWEFRSPHTMDGKVAILNDLLRLPVNETLLEPDGL